MIKRLSIISVFDIILQIESMASGKNSTTLSKLAVQWEWEGDKSVWQQFPMDIQQEISQAFDSGNKEVNNFLLNKKYVYTSKVIIDQTEEISMRIKFPEMVQINQKTKFMRRIRICIEFDDKNGFYVYEYENENKKWLVYNVEIMIKIAKAIENNESIVSIDRQNQSYDIDLDELIETNLSTKAIRKIRSVKSSLFGFYFFAVFRS